LEALPFELEVPAMILKKLRGIFTGLDYYAKGIHIAEFHHSRSVTQFRTARVNCRLIVFSSICGKDTFAKRGDASWQRERSTHIEDSILVH